MSFHTVRCLDCNEQFFSMYEPVVIEIAELHMMRTGHICIQESDNI